MKVNVLSIQKIEKEDSKLLGVASIVINDLLYVYDIKIVQGTEKIFIAMPSKKINDTFKDVAHPTNMQCKDVIEKAVLSAYNGQDYDEGNLEELKVTSLNIRPIESTTSDLVAVNSLVFNNEFVVNDVVLVKKEGMYSIYFPTRKAPDGTFKSICLIKNKDFMYSIEKVIVEAYIKNQK